MKKPFWFYTCLFLIFLLPSSLIGQREDPDSLAIKLKRLEQAPGFSETDTTYINTLYQISFGLGRENRDSSRVLALQTIALSEKINYAEGIAYGNYALALTKLLDGKPQEAIQLANISEQKAEILGLNKMVLRARNTKGIAYRGLQQTDSAFINYYRGLQLAEEMKSHQHLYAFHVNLGLLFLNNKNYQEALAHYKDAEPSVALLSSKPTPKEKNYSLSLKLKIAHVYSIQNQADSALSYLNQARLLIENQIGYAREHSDYWNEMGELHLLEMKPELADEAFFKALAITDSLNEPNRVTTLTGLAQSAFRQNKTRLSLQYARKALSIDQGQGLLKTSDDLYKLLALLYNTTGQKDSAQHFFEMYQDRYLKLQKSIMSKQIAILQTKESEKTRMAVTAGREKEEARTKNALTWFWVAICIAGLGLSIFFFRGYRQYQKEAVELDRINQEKDQLFTILGHDLRSPLSTMQELMMLYQEPMEDQDFLDSHLSSLKRRVFYSKETLNNMMHWVQDQLQDAKPNKELVMMEDLIPQCITAVYEIAAKKNLSISFTSEPRAMLMADPVHLEIILNNLLINAIKFSSENHAIRLNWSESESLKQLSIEDEGIGISQDQIQQFQKDGKLNSRKGTSGETGLGIGLSICQKLMYLNKGSLEIVNTGEGTRVNLLFKS